MANLCNQCHDLLVEELVFDLEVLFLRDEFTEVHTTAQQGLYYCLHFLDVVLELSILNSLSLSLYSHCFHPGLVEVLLLIGEV